MQKNKFTIDLGNLKLADAQYKKLLSSVHKTVNGVLKTVKTTAPSKRKPARKTMAEADIAIAATITADFSNANPGLSLLKATHKGIAKTLTQSGNLTFNNVSAGDIISIQGKSLGTSEISVDAAASPQQKKFSPGTFNFNFFIL